MRYPLKKLYRLCITPGFQVIEISMVSFQILTRDIFTLKSTIETAWYLGCWSMILWGFLLDVKIKISRHHPQCSVIYNDDVFICDFSIGMPMYFLIGFFTHFINVNGNGLFKKKSINIKITWKIVFHNLHR